MYLPARAKRSKIYSPEMRSMRRNKRIKEEDK